MQAILYNPFRIIGVFAGAKEKEIQKQKSQIAAFQRVGQEVKFNTDFAALGGLNRDETALAAAFSKIEQNHSKISHALFWFVEGNHLDEPAFAYMRDGYLGKAIEIWEQVTKSGNITARNYASFANLSTLKMAMSFRGDIDKQLLSEGIALKTSFIGSEFFKDFVAHVADENFKVNAEEQSKHFVEDLLTQLKPYTGKTGLSSGDLADLFKSAGSEVRGQFTSNLATEPLHNLETKVEKAGKSRRDAPENADKIGEKLYRDTKEDVATLLSLMGKNDINYQTAVDKLAQEILQCAIDYWNYYEDNLDADPGPAALKLCSHAQKLAVGDLAKDRIEDQSTNIQRLVNERPIRADVDVIIRELERSRNQGPSIALARSILSNCKPRLANIRAVLGGNHEDYLNWSNAVAVVGFNVAFDCYLAAHDAVVNAYQSEKANAIYRLNSVITDVISVINGVVNMDMRPDVRTHIRKELQNLHDVQSQINNAIANANRTNSDGCYIATMVYGDYEHPQVMALRRFRDEVLSTSTTGQVFIRWYYRHSPEWVRKLRRHRAINRMIRFFLDLFIKTIQKQ